ncbi:NaeI family type II restriction endonuclease, partial [Corynebacterium striatum]
VLIEGHSITFELFGVPRHGGRLPFFPTQPGWISGVYQTGVRSQPEGIVILGDYLKHQKIASELGLPIPKDGDSLSTRLVKCEKSFEGSKTYIDDSYWRIATPTDEVEPAPTLPFK